MSADPDDGDTLLAVVLDAVAAVGSDPLTVLRPVPGPDGVPADFVVVADTGLTAALAQRPSVGRSLRELMPAGLADRLVALNRTALATGEIVREDLAVAPEADGALVPVHAEAGVPSRRAGEVVRVPVAGHVVVLCRDVTEVRVARAELLAATQRFQRLLEQASDTVVVTTAERVITYASPSLGPILGVDPDTLVGSRFGSFFADDRGESVGTDLFERALAAPPGGTVRAEAEVHNGAREVRRVAFVATNWLDDPVVGGVVINTRDITEQHEARRRLEHQALSDALTGLPNRRWFAGAVDRALERSRRTGVPFALLLLDVDDFKVLNDSLGHSAGDRLLVEMSRRMVSVLGSEEAIGRLGGDEFVVLAENLRGRDAATAVARRIADAAGSRYDIAGLATHAMVSIGVVTTDGSDIVVGDVPPGAVAPAAALEAVDGPEPADARGASPSPEAEALLAHADAALYEAKRRGRNRVEVFDPALRERVLHRVHVESELHRALEDDELIVHWQPIVRARDGRRVALEGLVRWRHPVRGLLAAGDFLPVASDVGLMPSLCTRAVDLALSQAARWEQLPDPPQVFINLAPVQLTRPALADELANRVEEYGLTPQRIHFEVAEDVLGADVCRLAEQLTRLRERGFRIALDDFGAGNTALTWLHRLPVDTLKLDRSFTGTLDEPVTRTIVRSVLRLAADLGVQTVAEGVETPEQLAFFADAGCGFTQGWLHGYPSPADQVWPPVPEAGR